VKRKKNRSCSTVVYSLPLYFLAEVAVGPYRKRERGAALAMEKLLFCQNAVDFADRVCGDGERFGRGYGFLADQ
jgi:hypothetical protein